MAKNWTYGKDPNPSNWHIASEILKKNSPKKIKNGKESKK